MNFHFPQSTSAHGKLIISGEHAVVYGYKALVIESPVSIAVTIQTGESMYSGYEANILSVFEAHTKTRLPDLIITSTGSLPQKSSFGSSAAFAYAVLTCLMQACGMNFSQKELFDLVYVCEKYAHGNPSGVDPASVVFGGVLEFQKKDGIPQWKKLSVPINLLTPTMLIQSGPADESTKEMIEIASQHHHKESILSQIGMCTQRIIVQAKAGKLDTTSIRENEALLEELGVVGKKAKGIIKTIEKFGGTAKITGGGGRKSGSGVILAYHDNPEKLKDLACSQAWNEIPKE